MLTHESNCTVFSRPTQRPHFIHWSTLCSLLGVVLLLSAFIVPLGADVSLADQEQVKRHIAKLEDGKMKPHATGDRSTRFMTARRLVDQIGVDWAINTDLDFTTTSSASGAVQEAEFTHSVAATTSLGGTVNYKLNDAFDGYSAIALTFDGSKGPAISGNPVYFYYNQNGPASFDPTSGNRQLVLPPRTINPPGGGQIEVQRKVYVPGDDSFCRWLNIVRNTGATTVSNISVVFANNMGSDSNTIITNSSNGNQTGELDDNWVATMQNYSGLPPKMGSMERNAVTSFSSDVRVGHVLQGPNAPVRLSRINFAAGDDNPYWAYTFSLAPGQTVIIMSFATCQASKAAAAAQSTRLVTLPPSALRYMSPLELSQVKNFLINNEHWVEVTSGNGGHTSFDGYHKVNDGNRITITAYPDPGYRFVRWTGTVNGSDNPLTLTIRSNVRLQAEFTNDAPTVDILTPTTNAIVRGTAEVTVQARDDSGIAKVEYYVDDVLKQTTSTAPYSWQWDTRSLLSGAHTLRVVAYDAAGRMAYDQVTVQVQNVTLTLSASRATDSGWMLRKPLVRLELRAEVVSGLTVMKYLVYRKNGAAYQFLKEIPGGQVSTAPFVYFDETVEKGKTYTYKVTAVNVAGGVIGQSGEITI